MQPLPRRVRTEVVVAGKPPASVYMGLLLVLTQEDLHHLLLVEAHLRQTLLQTERAKNGQK